MNYSLREERYNTLSHAIGVIFSLVGGFFLIQKTIHSGNPWAIGSITVFILFMTLMFWSSTLYHFEKNESLKAERRKMDHAAIYTQIAGSYTPFTLVILRLDGAWGWSLFAIVWIAAIVGVTMSFLKLKNKSRMETVTYLAISWVVIVAFKPLIEQLGISHSMPVFYWLIAGGVFYTIGAIIYSLRKIEYTHAIWHLFVLGGGICHFVAIWNIKV